MTQPEQPPAIKAFSYGEGGLSTTPSRPSDAVLQHFEHGHLPPHLAGVSKLFGDLARQVAALFPESAEKTVALRKLLEGKDAAVRCAVAAHKAASGS